MKYILACVGVIVLSYGWAGASLCAGEPGGYYQEVVYIQNTLGLHVSGEAENAAKARKACDIKMEEAMREMEPFIGKEPLRATYDKLHLAWRTWFDTKHECWKNP
jgi:hypothetical protein